MDGDNLVQVALEEMASVDQAQPTQKMETINV